MALNGTPAWWPWFRDAFLLFGGFGGVVVLLIARVAYGVPVDFGLLALFGGMMGLPWYIRKDGK